MAALICLTVALGLLILQVVSAQNYMELYRPQYHFTTTENWMNDPAGLLYYNGTYHLYYQYNPGGITWGAMSWGHATSNDLIHWEHQPIALLARGFPGKITEMFFTGSAVADTENVSGFGTNGKVPFVAMYTSYYPTAQTLPSGKRIQEGTQAQSIAYSLDEGMTWTTYDVGNPVIALPPAEYADQYQEFRDPFVFWHESTRKWVVVLSLAKLHKLLIYTSDNLKDWTQVSEFGPMNAIGGVWECPSIIPLPLDGDCDTIKWVAQIGLNPGGPPGTVGSGTQYIVGDFDGTTFIADGSNLSATKAITDRDATRNTSDNVLFQGFEGNGSFADLGWTATGGLVGTSPAQGTLAGQQDVTGYIGSRLVNTFLNGDATTGTLRSPPFNITHKTINFLIGGGNAPNQACINLEIQNKVVRTAAGSNDERLAPQSWDVSAFIGQTAVITIVDSLTGGWGHINVDEITFSHSPAIVQETNWMDWGPDFYAAATYNGLSLTDRTNIAWMNNWQYGEAIPTIPWRSAMSIPRKLSLKTINGKATLIQQPAGDLCGLESAGNYLKSWDIFPEGNETLPLSGKTLDIKLTFFDLPTISSSPQFGIILRATSDLAQQTRVGYDFSTKQLFVDRTKSGNTSFDSTFASVYYAPLAPASDGEVKMRILLDWSSIEVFGGEGEVTMSTQIFPGDNGNDIRLFSTGGDTSCVTISAEAIGPAFDVLVS